MYRILVLCHPPLLTEPPPSGFSLPVLSWTPITGPLSLCHFSEDPWPGVCHLLMCATNRYKQPPAWGQTKATDLPCQPWASLDLSAWQCRAGPSWFPGLRRLPQGSLAGTRAADRWAGVSLPHPPTRTKLTLPERLYPAPSFRVTSSGRSLRVRGCAEEIMGKRLWVLAGVRVTLLPFISFEETIHR